MTLRPPALALVIAAAGCGSNPEVVVRNQAGSVVLRAEVELAVTEVERRTGLRGRDLEAGSGLLIVIPIEDDVCVDNSGVELAIDAVFVTSAMEVSAVERDIAAGDPTARCHTARWVLEVRAGEAKDVENDYPVDLP